MSNPTQHFSRAAKSCGRRSDLARDGAVGAVVRASMRISAIMDGHFSLIVDDETAPSEMRWGSAQVLC